MAVAVTILTVSCDDPAAQEAEELAKIKADSAAQGVIDQELIAAYIADPENGLSEYDTSFVADFEVKIYIKKPAVSNPRYPKANDLMSIRYQGKLLSNDIFDASHKPFAILTDSLAWTDKGIDFAADTIIWSGDTLVVNGRTLEEILIWLADTRDPLYYTLYSDDKRSETTNGLLQDYSPIMYNHTADGRFVASYFPLGLRVALRATMSYLPLGGTAVIIFPSVAGFANDFFLRTLDRDGDGKGEVEYILPNNSCIVYEINLEQLRP